MENIYCHNKIIANIIKLTHKYHPNSPFFHTTAGTLPGKPEKSSKRDLEWFASSWVQHWGGPSCTIWTKH